MRKDFQTTKDILYWQQRINPMVLQKEKVTKWQEFDQSQTKVNINVCVTIRTQIMTSIKENLDSELYES
jgi:hypothetical protein